MHCRMSCVQGTKLGTFLFQSPNRTTIGIVGSDMLISWSYSTLVTRPPMNVQIFMSTVDLINWKMIANVELEENQKSIIFQIAPTGDDKYKLRIYGDNKDPMNATKPCFEDGQALVGLSSEFRITTPKQVYPYPEKYGPSSNARNWKMCLFLFLFLLN